MSRYEYDDSNFMISFMKNPKAKTLEYLQKAEDKEAQYNKSLKTKKPLLQEYCKKVSEYKYDEEKARFTLSATSLNSVTI
jgi:cell division protein FtsB